MRITQRAIDLIKQFEGFKPYVYICPAGKKTIGYGHVLLPNEDLQFITEAEGETLLLADLAKIERGIFRNIYVPLEDYQLDSLASFTFNVGLGRLQASTLRQKLNRQEYEEVPREMRRWVFVRGKKSKGLIIRREIESQLFENGEYPNIK